MVKKPTPPGSPVSPIPSPHNLQTGPNLLSVDQFAPVAPPGNLDYLLDEEQNQLYLDGHLIEARDAGVGISIDFDDANKICLTCQNYWKIETMAPVKNLKPDGSPYTKREEYCIFSDKLFTLSDRGAVLSCTRFCQK